MMRLSFAGFLILVATKSAGGRSGKPPNVQEPAITRLTTTAARNGQASWSPNGRELAFVSNRSGSWQVWLMSATGANPRQLTQSAGPVGWPTWTPNGDAILYYASTATGHRLFKVTLHDGHVEPFLHESFQDFRPLLSPDGTRLLFDRIGPDMPRNHDLFVRQLSDSALRQLTRDPGYDSDARWSPDGGRIAWHSDRGATTRYQTQVYVMNADGSNVVQLTRGADASGYPAWSPNGTMLAYRVESAGNRDIWIIDADGRFPQRLTFHSGVDGDPVWSPDGDKLLFATGRYGGEELATLDVPPRTPRGDAPSRSF